MPVIFDSYLLTDIYTWSVMHAFAPFRLFLSETDWAFCIIDDGETDMLGAR